jgi:transcription elongation factor GreA
MTPSPAITVGSYVTVSDPVRDREQSFRLVEGAGDPRHGAISSESPVGRALAGHRVGDTVAVSAPAGERRLLVIALA